MTSFQLFSSSPFLCALGFLILVLVNIQLSLSNPDLFEDCKGQFTCGNITAGYPFWGGGGETYGRPEPCGHNNLGLYCENNTTIMRIKDVGYRVLNINESAQVLKIARQDYLSGICLPEDELVDTTIDPTLFEYSAGFFRELDSSIAKVFFREIKVDESSFSGRYYGQESEFVWVLSSCCKTGPGILVAEGFLS